MNKKIKTILTTLLIIIASILLLRISFFIGGILITLLKYSIGLAAIIGISYFLKKKLLKK